MHTRDYLQRFQGARERLSRLQLFAEAIGNAQLRNDVQTA